MTKKKRAQPWTVTVTVHYPADSPNYPRCALRIRAATRAFSAEEAAEVVLMSERKDWPDWWTVEEPWKGRER